MDLVSVIKIMMREDKVLLCIDRLEDIDRYKELGISHFLVPLENYTIGYDSFSFEEISKIDANVYILANRVLTDEDIDEFLNLKIPKNVKGFVIEDIGLYYELKSRGYKLINFQNHLNNNYETINFWLKHFDSLVISTDITKEEIIEIVDKSTKPLILNTFGYPLIMYSRRNLVSNFNRHFNNEPNSQLTIEENIFKSNFLILSLIIFQ